MKRVDRVCSQKICSISQQEEMITSTNRLGSILARVSENKHLLLASKSNDFLVHDVIHQLQSGEGNKQEMRGKRWFLETTRRW